MQREEKIAKESLVKITEAIYDGEPQVFEAYSQYESKIRDFPSKESLDEYISDELSKDNRHKSIYCVLAYPGSGGVIRERRIDLDPNFCEGATFRYTIEGWALIQFQLGLTDMQNISCRFAVNSEKRANKWWDTYPELDAPSLWDWTVVEKHARRLIRVLRKHSKSIETGR